MKELTPERIAAIKVATEKLLAAEQKRAAALPNILADLAREAPNWPSAEVLAKYAKDKKS